MQLTVWTYEAPPHVGAMRVATAMEGVHYVLHAPQGDTYADLLPGFNWSSQRQREPIVVPGQTPRRAFSTQGSCEVWC
jgi:light-independent protochlorophyllide reductase subunit B